MVFSEWRDGLKGCWFDSVLAAIGAGSGAVRAAMPYGANFSDGNRGPFTTVYHLTSGAESTTTASAVMVIPLISACHQDNIALGVSGAAAVMEQHRQLQEATAAAVKGVPLSSFQLFCKKE